MSARCGWVVLLGLFVLGFQACGTTQRNYGPRGDGGAGPGPTPGGEAGERNHAGEPGAIGGQGGAAGEASSAGDGGMTALGGAAPLGGAMNAGGGAAGGDSSSSAGAPSAGAAGDSSQIACGVLQLACGGECIDPSSELDHCGRCDHSCGPKSECKQGRCETATILTSEYAVFGLDVSEDGLFFSNGNTLFRCATSTLCAGGATQVGSYPATRELRVTRGLSANMLAVYGNIVTGPINDYIYCPTSGCLSEPKAFASFDGRGGRLTGLIAAGSDFYFELAEATGPEGKKLYRVPAKTTPLTAVPLIDRLPESSPIVADDTNVYFARTDQNGENARMVYCSRASACIEASPLLPEVPHAVAAHAGKFYWFSGAPGNIRRCEAADCANTTEPVQYLASGVEELVADDDGIFWLSTSTISACSLPDCSGGPRLLATIPSGSAMLRTFGGFVYWSVVSDNASATTLYRVAKP